jgi:LPXTG-motif cell wall-anchored protein
MLAMVLVAAAPALAQDADASDEGSATGGDVTTETQYLTQVVDCEVVIGDVSLGQYGDANALGDEAVAEIANEQGVSIEVVQTCIAAGGDASVNAVTGEVVESGDNGDNGDTEAEELPDTGGASLFTLGAGALLVGGGLLARRIFS